MALPFLTEHRVYPAPIRPWIIWQRWHDLLFAHWPVSLDVLRGLVPAALELDAFEGQGWIGVVPFRMSRIRPRWLPAAPWLSAFPELNVRTYVTMDNKPGVYFFSLDTANPVAVKVARWWFHLPYHDAGMSLVDQDGWIHYRSQRHGAGPPACFEGRYQPSGPVMPARPGSLEHWLTERYCMYPVDRVGQVYRGEIHHPPWPLQPARAEIAINTMTAPAGLAPPNTPPLLHFARELRVVVWGLERLSKRQ